MELSDANDTPPRFVEARYTAVVPENSPPGTLVTQVAAEDPDLGESGRVHYAFPAGSNAVSLLTLFISESVHCSSVLALKYY